MESKKVEKEVLTMRMEVEFTENAAIETICEFHRLTYLVRYTSKKGGKCCDPFSLHKKAVSNKSLRALDLNFCKDVNSLAANCKPLVPGKKACSACKIKLNALLQPVNIGSNNSSDTEAEEFCHRIKIVP